MSACDMRVEERRARLANRVKRLNAKLAAIDGVAPERDAPDRKDTLQSILDDMWPAPTSAICGVVKCFDGFNFVAYKLDAVVDLLRSLDFQCDIFGGDEPVNSGTMTIEPPITLTGNGLLDRMLLAYELDQWLFDGAMVAIDYNDIASVSFYTSVSKQ